MHMIWHQTTGLNLTPCFLAESRYQIQIDLIITVIKEYCLATIPTPGNVMGVTGATSLADLTIRNTWQIYAGK